MELTMRNTTLAIGFLTLLITPAAAQKAEIAASLYTVDAAAFPPGSGMVKGRDAIAAMWKSMAEHVSVPKLTTLDVKRLGPSAARLQPED
jgi:ketosteroid isomerase-like protein